MHHDKFMQKAIELARQGEGLTYPNPPVGAVLVENNSIVATGWHEKSNLDHAEVVCIKNNSKWLKNLCDKINKYCKFKKR